MIGMNYYMVRLSGISFKEFEGMFFYLSRDFQRTGEVLLGPVMEALAPIANTTMESQVCEFILFIQPSFFKTDNHGKLGEAFKMHQSFLNL
jgi:hypothetical protein